MLTRQVGIFPYGYPSQIAIITVEWGGRKNMMAAGWHSMLSMNPPLYGVAVSEERYSYSMIRKAEAFAVHFLPAEKIEWIELAGRNSGREVDKFQKASIPSEPGAETGMPIIPLAHVAYECKVKEVYPLGDHHWFVGEIVAAYKDEEKLDSMGFPVWENVTLPLYLGKDMERNKDRYIVLNKERNEVEWDAIPDQRNVREAVPHSSGSSAL
ncbi:Flavin reductase domain protein FMN-binding protein (modular protein) [[Clostridium] ultunense Esp]|nr:Flavin reductase domain protein FMN-binding protein (modular protein) [[Clostridium] ultunense Esp]